MMSRVGRRVSATVNPVSTAVTKWWCHSAARHLLTGHGPTAGQRRAIKARVRARRAGGEMPGTGFIPSAEQMKARKRAIDELMASSPGSADKPPDK
jgi:hypothetical protein